jgi:hypothetical protein
MSEYVDMTEKWSKAMELLKQPPAAERRAAQADRLDRFMWAFLSFFRILALGAAFWGAVGLFGYHVMGWWR